MMNEGHHRRMLLCSRTAMWEMRSNRLLPGIFHRPFRGMASPVLAPVGTCMAPRSRRSFGFRRPPALPQPPARTWACPRAVACAQEFSNFYENSISYSEVTVRYVCGGNCHKLEPIGKCLWSQGAG